MFCQMMFGLSFYGVMVILTRFFLEDLNYSEADTMMVVGAFSSIGPCLPSPEALLPINFSVRIVHWPFPT